MFYNSFDRCKQILRSNKFNLSLKMSHLYSMIISRKLLKTLNLNLAKIKDQLMKKNDQKF